MEEIRLANMNWRDIEEAIENGFLTVVMAIGSTEQHGPHLPLKTDTLIGDAIAYGVAKKLGNALQAPTIQVGCSEHHLSFPGTLSIQPATLKSLLRDLVDSLAKHGFKRIVLLPSHGGNFATVGETVEELRKKYTELKIIGYTDLKGFVDALLSISEEFGVTKEEAGAHAGENETSFILFLEENLVKKGRFSKGYLGPLGDEEIKIILEKGMPALSKNGVLGDPSKANPEKGRAYLERMVNLISAKIKEEL